MVSIDHSWRELRAFVLPCLIVCLCGVSGAADKFNARDYRSIPDWLKAAAALPSKEYHYDEAPSHEILIDEAWYELKSDGSFTQRSIFAIRLLNHEGAKAAVGRAVYLKETDKIHGFDCWLIEPDEQKAIRNKLSEALDMDGTGASSIASSGRAMVHDARSSAKAGQVFAYEAVSERRSLIGAKAWFFQSSSPVRSSRLNIKLPSGWTLQDWKMGDLEMATGEVDGWNYWQCENLDPHKRQDYSPESSRLRQSVAISIFPPAGDPIEEDFITVRSWEDMAQLFYPKYRERMVLSEEGRAAALAATEGASSNYEKAKALAEMAQSVNYTNVSLNLGLGGGYIPRYSSEVHRLGWGDCKDKSTYLCSLLETVGLKGYPVIVNGSPRHWIDPDVPNPQQFNHCISAIQADESFPEENTIEVAGLGRLLIFDPTDPFTAVGDLSDRMHGTGAVLLSDEHGGFVNLPRVEGAANVETWDFKAELMPNGSIVGLVSMNAIGQSAMKYRVALLRNDSKSDLEDALKDDLDDSLGTLKTVGFTYSDDRSSGRFEYQLQFGAPGYIQYQDADRARFSPVLAHRQSVVLLDDPGEQRSQPILLSPRHWVGTFEVFLPIGFVAPEVPEPVSLKTEFGEYSLKMSVEGDKLLVERRLFVTSKPMEPEQADAIEAFYRAVAAADGVLLSVSRKS